MSSRIDGRSLRSQAAMSGRAPESDSRIELTAALHDDVHVLASEIGERNTARYWNLDRAATFIHHSLQSAGLPVSLQTYAVDGQPCHNVISELTGIGDDHEVVLIGAHYDSVRGGPGANDNASGVAALLVLARSLIHGRLNRTLRFVAFVNEEPPCIRTKQMGSLVYARACRNRADQIVAMLSLETLAFFPSYDSPSRDPWPAKLLHPLQGGFLALVSNLRSRRLAQGIARTFRGATDVRCGPSHFPVFCRPCARPITGHSGNAAIRPLWRLIRRRFAIRFITLGTTR
jgi:hypothetical protein